MSDKDNSFRSSITGFNRKDVLAYIESRSQTYAEKLKELGSRLDVSHEDLTKTRASLAQANASLIDLQKTCADQTLLLDSANDDIVRLSNQIEELRRSSAERDEELRTVRIERDALSRKLTEQRAAISEYEQSKLRVANIELEAYARAKKIKDEAISIAASSRKTLNGLINDAKKRYQTTKDAATRDILHLSDEMEQIRDAISGLTSYFENIDFEIASLESDNQTLGATIIEPSSESAQDSL